MIELALGPGGVNFVAEAANGPTTPEVGGRDIAWGQQRQKI